MSGQAPCKVLIYVRGAFGYGHRGETRVLRAGELPVLDWGSRGLMETLDTLHVAGLKIAGACRDLREALQPAVHEFGTSRLLVFAAVANGSGVPPRWAAT